MDSSKDIIINIENIAYGGYGIGRIDGKVVLVESAIPGDVAQIKFREEHKDYSIALIEKIIEPSPSRITPDCPLSGICGGCSYLCTDYNTELEFKRYIIKDQLKRIAGFTDESFPHTETVSGNRYGYRSHTRFSNDRGIKGFYRKGTNETVPFPEQGCLLLADELNSAIKGFNQDDDKNEIKAAMDCRSEVHFSSNGSPKEIVESEHSLLFHRDINGFFQANRFLRGEMIRKVAALSSPDSNSTFLDICSGCGYFTLPLSLNAGKGYGFDIDQSGISFARKNAKINGIKNVKFFNIPESEIKPHIYSPEVVVIDPPRSGLSKRGRRTVNAIKPDRIVYVSCNPSTFARDVRDFMKNGYSLDNLIFIDMFPCTHHIELISLLTK